MNAAQMLAAAGEPNTTAGREKFHQRFPSKAAFDAWYTPKKEYGGGLTDGIAFPQQPDASSRRVPYYDKGGFFAPNVMPWNGPIGFYEHGGLHKYQGDIGGSQVPPFLGTDPNNYYTERDQAALQGQQNFGDQGFDYEGPITRPGYSFPPSVTPSPYTPYIPGLELGEDSDRNPNVNIGVGDPYTRKKHPSGGGGNSRHRQPFGKQLGRWWEKNFQGRGGGRKYNVNRCWKGNCHEYGGMTDGIAFPQQPTEHINFSAFPWQPKYDMGGMNYNMGGLPMNDNGEPCYECGGYMEPGGPVGYKPAPNPDTYFNEQDAALDFPAKGNNVNIDYSKVTKQGPALSQYSTTELNNMGANIPVPNPAQDARFKKIADYNKEHPYIPAGGNLFKRPDGSADRFNYTNGAYTPYQAPTQPLVNNRYGGYMETGGTTEMDQGQYTNGMAQEYMKSLADFSMAAQPTEMGNVQEAGYGAYGGYMKVGGNNQMSDFNTLDMTNINNTSLREAELNKLKNNSRNSFTNLLNVPANMAANTYLKKPTYTTQTVGSGMINTNEEPNADGRLTQSQIANWEPTQNSMYARYGGNMFRNGGLKKYGPGASVPGYTDEEVANADKWIADQVAESAANEAQNSYYKQLSDGTLGNNSGTNQGTTNTNTNVGNTNDNTMGDTRMTADELAYFRGMMRGSNQGNYAPSWQAQQNQNNGYDAWKAMSKDPEALKKFLSNSGIQDMKWNNKMGMFGPKSKGHITFRTFWDASKGKYVKSAVDEQASTSDQSGTTQPGAGQQMQKGPKGPGFIQNLIAKNKQRKADKIYNKVNEQQKLREIEAQEREQRPTVDNSTGIQNQLAKDQQMPLTGDERKNEFFNNKLYQEEGINGMTIPKIGFEYGGFPQYGYGGYSQYGYGGAPQYNYGGYPEYEEGAELDMSPEEIENYLAMGGTLEYLD